MHQPVAAMAGPPSMAQGEVDVAGLPSRWFGLAMKVNAMPSCAAISLAPFL